MVLKLLLGLLIILIGAELFTNGVEWLGSKLRLSEGAVGNLLAAVGTALPESILPIVAFCSGSEDAVHIGVGAILGAPFMLGTLAMFITGFSAWFFSWRGEGRKVMWVDEQLILRDLRFIIGMYFLVMAAAFFPGEPMRYLIVFALVAGYGFYALLAVRGGGTMSSDRLKPLYLGFRSDPSLLLIIGQLVIGLTAIVGGANYFVSGIEQLAVVFQIQPLILALIIAPIATELPEKFNSVIWVAQKKDGLALGNITGAMVFQSTLIPAVGIMATSWQLDLPSLLSSFFLILSLVVLYANITRGKQVSPWMLMLCGLCYLGFLGMIGWGVL